MSLIHWVNNTMYMYITNSFSDMVDKTKAVLLSFFCIKVTEYREVRDGKQKNPNGCDLLDPAI